MPTEFVDFRPDLREDAGYLARSSRAGDLTSVELVRREGETQSTLRTARPAAATRELPAPLNPRAPCQAFAGKISGFSGGS